MKASGLIPVYLVLGASVIVMDGAYRATQEPLRYTSTNSYEMWFVQAGDTLGQPIETQTQETHSFSESTSGLDLEVVLEGPGFKATTVYGIDTSGRVRTVDGVPFHRVPNARVDVLPRITLPRAELAVGSKWTESVQAGGSQDYGETRYRAERSFEIVDELDFHGVRVFLMVGMGEMSLRHGGWQDAEQEVAWWQDVSGPVVDSVWFDAEAGQLVGDATHMDLSGTGGTIDQVQTVELPSGLRSSVRRVPAEID